MESKITNNKKWKTSIANSTDKQTLVRGYPLEDLIQNLNFTQAIYLILKGELPTKQEEQMLNAIFVAAIDHGIASPSSQVARIVFSGGNSLNTAVGAGILTLGDSHGGAIEQCAKLLQENKDKPAKEIVAEILQQKKVLPGLGHKIYKDEDPRTIQLFSIAKKLRLYGNYCKLTEEIQKEIEKQKGKKLCINIDGAIAAIMSEMQFDWRLGKGLFIIPRTAGLVAHAHEEWCREKPFRRLEENEYSYDGKEERRLPQK